MHRREFIWQSLSVAGALPLAAHAGAVHKQTPDAASLHVLVDTRFKESRYFGEAAADGARVSFYNGDLTQLWQHTLLQQWRSGRGRMAGVSTARGWLCLSQLAGEYRWIGSERRLPGSPLIAWSLTCGERA